MHVQRTESRHALVAGRPAPATLNTIIEAADRCSFDVHREATRAGASAWLERTSARVILVDATPEGVETSANLRCNADLAATPIVAVGRAPGDLLIHELFASGVDDVTDVATGARTEALARRFRSIARAGAPQLPAPKGAAIVADVDERSRALIGRVLRNAGYRVSFAMDGQSLGVLSSDPSVSLVVASSVLDRDGEGDMAVLTSRRRGARAPWILLAPPREATKWRDATVGLGVTIHDAFAPPESVLFVANELARSVGNAADGRSARRALYSAAVRWRVAGTAEDDLAFTYNVSAGGAYVRTLCPPEVGAEVWLELRPPREARVVRLEAIVAWRRNLGPSEAAIVPPGFGARITGGSRGDLERYVRGCKTFIERAGDPAESDGPSA